MSLLRLLVLSDLHCHRLDREQAGTFLLAGALRVPENSHPVQAMIRRFPTESLGANALLCPGDLADQICQTGFTHAFDVLREISRHFRIPHLVTTLGNHDVDSRRKHGEDPFAVAETINPDFPVVDAQNKDSLFSSGSCIVETPELQVIVINSVIDHDDEASAKRGTFEGKRLERLRTRLEGLDTTRQRMAVLHHHVALHSSPVTDDKDLLPTGDQLTNLLAEFDVRFVLHGHKHHPRVRYVDSTSGPLLVLGAGSFSAYLGKKLSSLTRNVFHLVEIDAWPFGQMPQGSIYTWEWHQGEGWFKATPTSADFPHRCGFGVMTSNLSNLARELTNLLDQSPEKWILPGDEVLAHEPSLKYLTPQDQSQLSEELARKSVEIRWNNFELARIVSQEVGSHE